MSFDLERFVSAQDLRGTGRSVYEDAVIELTAGRKRTHWMWYVFPQVRGLGSSPTSQHYGISGAAEARAYLHHEVLGPRLNECVDLVLAVPDRTADDIFGTVDAMKLRSSVTLFADVAGGDGPIDFTGVLDRYFDGDPDERTLGILRAQG
ncbi:MAG: DUF1810 domain-containing protein [Actinomycetales bacterium]